MPIVALHPIVERHVIGAYADRRVNDAISALDPRNDVEYGMSLLAGDESLPICQLNTVVALLRHSMEKEGDLSIAAALSASKVQLGTDLGVLVEQSMVVIRVRTMKMLCRMR